jgi:hypothetical protein
VRQQPFEARFHELSSIVQPNCPLGQPRGWIAEVKKSNIVGAGKADRAPEIGGSEDARSIADLDGGGEVAKACDIPKLARMASTGIDHFVMAITWRRPFRDGHHIGRPKQGLPIRQPPLGDYRRVQP